MGGRSGSRQITEKQRERSARLTDEERALADRLTRARVRLRVTLASFGELLGCDEFMTYKLESGLVRLRGVRVQVLEAVERALERARPDVVYGPPDLPTGQRLARIFVLAYPEAAA